MIAWLHAEVSKKELAIGDGWGLSACSAVCLQDWQQRCVLAVCLFSLYSHS